MIATALNAFVAHPPFSVLRPFLEAAARFWRDLRFIRLILDFERFILFSGT